MPAPPITILPPVPTYPTDQPRVFFPRLQAFLSGLGVFRTELTALAAYLEGLSVGGSIADDAVTNAKLANMAASTIKARKTASAGDPEDCTLSEVLDLIGSAAQGDIFYRGAESWTRLGAGTSGQFLKTNGAGANPAWANGANAAYRGALVFRGSDQTTANYTTATAIPFPSEDHDTSAFHDNSTNNTRITIPSGVSRVRLSANCVYANLTANEWKYVTIRKNGSEGYDGRGQSTHGDGQTVGRAFVQTGKISVSPGDYFEFFLQIQTDTSITVGAQTWFDIEVFE